MFRRHWPLILLLIITTVLYARSIGNGFVSLDDPLLVTENRMVTEPSLRHVFDAFRSFDPELYVPLTFLSFQAEAWTLGPGAWHFHLINLLLHLAAVIIIFSIVLALTRRRDWSLLAAALFAIHPVNAEAVLWVSSRKDVLSTVFALASLRMFLAERTQPSRLRYVLRLVLFVLALLSKVTVLTLPLIFLLTDLYRGNSVGKKQIKEITPFLLLSILFGAIAIVGKTHIVGREELSTLVLMAFRSTFFSLRLLVFPYGQSAIHILHEPIGITSPLFALSIIIVTGLSLCIWRMRRRFPSVAFGWVVFLVALAPTFLHYSRGGEDILLGSERYLYFPFLGLSFIAAGVFVGLRESRAVTAPTRTVMSIGLAGILLGLGSLTFRQASVFRDGIAFNKNILLEEPLDARTHYNLGNSFLEAGRLGEAEASYRTSLALNRTAFALPAINLGILLVEAGRTDEGLWMLRRATAIRPDYFLGYYNLGVAYQKTGRFSEAIPAYKKTIELFPEYPAVHHDLAVVYGQKKMYREALAEFKILSDLDPGFREKLRTVAPAFVAK